MFTHRTTLLSDLAVYEWRAAFARFTVVATSEANPDKVSQIVEGSGTTSDCTLMLNPAGKAYGRRGPPMSGFGMVKAPFIN
jgi:hypothetical protein